MFSVPFRYVAILAFPSLCIPLATMAASPVVISATRVAQPTEESIASVVVISRAEIAQSQAQDTADLLRLHAGVDVARNGGPGQTTSVFMRGAESNHTLVMIDGVKINAGTVSTAAIQNIRPEMIERIEIVKGPRSVLYGSEAVGGVINIITRRGAMGQTIEAAIEGGEYNTQAVRGAWSYGGGQFRAGVRAEHFQTDGFPTLSTDNRDRGHRDGTGQAYAGLRMHGLDVELSHWQSTGTTEYSGYLAAPLDQDFRNAATQIALKANPLAPWATHLRLSQIEDRIDQNKVNFLNELDHAHTRRTVFDWQNDVQWAAHLLTGGVVLSRENTSARSYGTVYDVDTDSDALYLQDQIHFGPHRFLAALRYTDHETAGNHTTWNLGYRYEHTATLQWVANAGTAFREPDAADRYGYGGNPNLKPEISRTLELGVRHQPKSSHEVGLTAFDTRIEDLITYNDPDFFDIIPGLNENIEEAHITGIEANYGFSQGPWRSRAQITLQNPESLDSGEVLARRARQAFTASFGYDVQRYAVGLEMLAQGRRKDSNFSDDINAGYGIVNATAVWRPHADWTLRARLENLFDKDYVLAHGYNTSGRAAYVSLAYAFGNAKQP